MSLVLVWLIILILILVNALYVAAEFAIVSVRRSRLRQLVDEGDEAAKRLLPVLADGKNLDQYVATCQIGITASSLALGAFGQSMLSHRLAPWLDRLFGLTAADAASLAAIIVLLSLTILQMVIGELVPKSIALQFPTQTALLTHPPMRLSIATFSWFITILNGSGIAILKLFGVPESSHRHIHSPDQIETLFAKSRAGGMLEADEHQRLRRALRLASRPSEQIMVPRPRIFALDSETPPEEVLQTIIDCPFTRVPVYRGSIDNLIGTIHTKDVVMSYVENGKVGPVESLLRPLPALPESVPADRVLTLLRQARSHQAMVVDEFGGVAGLVTLEDVLSEILGNVGDEKKEHDILPEHLSDGWVRLPGSMRLDEAEPWLGVLWRGSATTVGGRILEELAEMPTAGKTLMIDGVEVTIESVEGRAIATVVAKPRAQEEGQNDG